METPGTLGSGGAEVAPSGESRAAVPRRRRDLKDSLPELPLVLFSGPRTPAAAACPPRPVLRLHHYSSSSEQTALQTNSLAKHAGDAVRTHAFGATPHGRVGGQHPRGLPGSGASPPPGYPGTPSQPPVIAWKQKPGGNTPRPVTPCPAPPARSASRGPCVQQAPWPSVTTSRSWVFLPWVAAWGDSHRHPRKLSHGNKKQRRV